MLASETPEQTYARKYNDFLADGNDPEEWADSLEMRKEAALVYDLNITRCHNGQLEIQEKAQGALRRY